ncbi:hypothetical protein FHETE_11457 [Fusarium heterosporum]|uniref:Uncharacterized protein n=1 Tax=Fusarium heterosporum TaxID=42747 RepID=A0A8H5SEV4_FUSHE|nr:hypothetical protein FHETE_11457 [Fusarium heterosporum]
MLSRTKIFISATIHSVLIVGALAMILILFITKQSESEGIFKLLRKEIDLTSRVAEPSRQVDSWDELGKHGFPPIPHYEALVTDSKSTATRLNTALQDVGNLSVGMRSMCVESTQGPHCSSLPLKNETPVPDIYHTSPEFKALIQVLERLPPFAIFPGLGLFGMVLSSLLMATRLPFRNLVRIVVSFLGLLSFLVFALSVSVVYGLGLGLRGQNGSSLQRGFAMPAGLAMLVISFVHFILAILEWVILL